MRSVLIALCVAAAGITERGGYGEEAAALPLASVRVDVQMVNVSMADAGKLVPAFQDRKTADAAWAQVQGMIARGEAKLLGWPVLWLQNGTRGVVENIEEVRYATEFDPPHWPTVFAPSPLIFPTWGPKTPTAFETRNVGATFEAEARVEQDGQVVALNIVPQFVRPPHFHEWQTQRSPLGIAGVHRQPDFPTSKITTQLRVHRDQPALVGVFVLPDPQPRVDLFILHAKATLLPPTAGIPSKK